MAGWFSRATKGSNPSEAEPVVYRLTCDCGGVVTGMRHQRMLVADCKKCGNQLFVLPVSAYPRPKRPAAKKPPVPSPPPPPIPRKKRIRDDDDSPPEPIILDTSSRTSTHRESASSKPRKVKETSSSPDLDLPRLQKPRAKILTPLRLLLVSMGGILILSVWWGLHRQAVLRANQEFAVEARAARSALEQSKFDEADAHFRKAIQALNLLKREDHEARLVRQLAAETRIANELALVGLFELIGEARQARKSGSSDWNQPLKQSYAGSWLVFDTTGLKLSSDSGLGFTVSLTQGTDPVQIRGDLSRWKSELGGSIPPQLIFAAQIEDIGPRSSGWEIVLRPETLTLWVTGSNYQALGMPLDDSTQSTLRNQAKLLGLEP